MLMPGNPKRCRMHAARCAELAVTAKTAPLRATFLGLSKEWERLAINLETTQALIGEAEPVTSRSAANGTDSPRPPVP